MELSEIKEKFLKILGIADVYQMPQRLMEVVISNETDTYERVVQEVGDMTNDWLQKIFQYYHADRKEKMQDYTPKSLAMFIGKLTGKADVVVDLCAGSGALTIQTWNMNHEQKFELYEFDENVIPFLLFNMTVRNIECMVYHSDVLQQEIFHIYRISKGEVFGEFREVMK